MAFESDARLPRSLLAHELLLEASTRVAGQLPGCQPLTRGAALGFDNFAQAVDRVILLEAEREKENLASSLLALGGDNQSSAGADAAAIEQFVKEFRRPLLDAGFRLASKRDLAISKALQSASQRVLRSEVVIDDRQLIDLTSESPGRGTLPSSKVLIFWRGAGVQQRAGGLFFEKLDYLQGEALSLVLGFWVDSTKSAWKSFRDGRDVVVDSVGEVVASAKESASSALAFNATGIGSAANFSLSNGRLGSGGGAKGRIRSARIGSIEVMTPDEVLRCCACRMRAVITDGDALAECVL